MNKSREWFADWFDSPYYHILYKNRDFVEAEVFLNNIVNFLKIPVNSNIIDLACGKGRHAIFLNKKGFTVRGVDLSENSIQQAKNFENEKLHFEVGDLRSYQSLNLFDYAFNLFTSFAYFKSDEENKLVLNNFNQCLKPNGILLIDFFNAEKVRQTTIINENKEVDGIVFQINKHIENNKVVKRIEFNDQGKEFYYQEEVQLLDLKDFENLLSEAGFTILNVFGNYNLATYEPQISDRLVIIAQKTT